MTFDQWFQLRLDSLRRQNEWRKIDCLLASKEYVRDAWEHNNAPGGYVLAPMKPTRAMIDAMNSVDEDGYWAMYEAAIAAAPKETK